MRNLTATICLMIAALVGSAGVTWGAEFEKGLAAYERRDYATALREWTPLAEQGNAAAQRSLGEMYRQGNGVRQNYKDAAWLFRLAAEQGDVDAQIKLGAMYANGNGVPLDNMYAYMWWSIAATSLDRTAMTNRDKIAGKLSNVQLEQAQELVRECARKAYRGC